MEATGVDDGERRVKFREAVLAEAEIEELVEEVLERSSAR